MNLITFLNNSEWDEPFFKKLARNDTGNAPGHQGGLVVPIPLRKYFPRLIGRTSPEQPTVDTEIKALLFYHQKEIQYATIRYQIQTWGDKRNPESRLTGSLSPIRNQASEDDILIFQRHKDSLFFYRFILIAKNTADYSFLNKNIKGRWGILFEQPMTEHDLNSAEEEQSAREEEPFNLYDPTPDYNITYSKLIARSYAFRSKIIELYNRTCCVCRTRLKAPSGVLELDAAHIVPRSKSGVDDARNGIALCKRHHWAFDKGLFSIDENRSVYVPEVVLNIPGNSLLENINNIRILEASDQYLKAREEAFKWHRENVLII